MGEDSFRGTCINCGQPVAAGQPCRNCQAALVHKVETAGRWIPGYSERYETRKTPIATIPEPKKEIVTMNGVQVCERCGSIGQGRDFISVSASSISGAALHMPELINMTQLEKLQEDDADLEFQSNYVLCRNCKTALTSFLHNLPTDSGQAGPIQPKLPKPSDTPAGQPTTFTGQSGAS